MFIRPSSTKLQRKCGLTNCKSTKFDTLLKLADFACEQKIKQDYTSSLKNWKMCQILQPRNLFDLQYEVLRTSDQKIIKLALITDQWFSDSSLGPSCISFKQLSNTIMIQSLVICLISKINRVTDPYPSQLIIYFLNRQVKIEMVKSIVKVLCGQMFKKIQTVLVTSKTL